jgi:cytoskeletal protein RodZ
LKFKPNRGPKFVGNTKYLKGKNMKIYVLTAIAALALPFMALGQTTEEPQQTQGQTKETQTTAPAKGKKMRPAQEQSNPQAKPETSTNVRGQTNVQGRTQDVNRNQPDQPGARSSTSQTNVNTNQTTTVNKDEFRMRHTEVFSLGRHPKEFFVQRYGANHFRLIGNSYFVFVDGCWVAVDVDGFTYTQRVICPGEPDFVEVVD